MNWLDIGILIIVGVSAFMGLKIGLIRAGFTALGIFVGSVLGGQLSDDIAGMFSNIDSDSAVATVVSYAIIISICLTGIGRIHDNSEGRVRPPHGLGGQTCWSGPGSGLRWCHLGGDRHGNGKLDL